VPADEELEGTTLRIYVVLVNEKGPLGPRELARAANLSSPSVAYRHLQKLEELDLVEKNQYREYAIKQRQSVKGYFWVGSRLFPRLVFYSFFFTGILIMEIVIAAARFLIGEALQYDFAMLIFVTATAVSLFLIEGVLSARLGKKKTAA
jgi:DNA-binding transcriptional ArsR family regulator